MITIPVTVSTTQVSVPVAVSTGDVGLNAGLGAAYTPTIIETNFPSGGLTGDLLAKRSDVDFDVEWITPATSAEQDNTRPITAGAVYTEIGNINALLATI